MNNIAKFAEQSLSVFSYGQIKQLPARSVIRANDNAMVCEKVNPATGRKEQYAFAQAYFVYAGKQQSSVVAVPVSTLMALPDADSSKKVSGPRLTLGQVMGK